jgi:tetratricopeptide (TPR) repeat protein
MMSLMPADRSNAPLTLPALVGREEEKRALRAALWEPGNDHRVVCLEGPPGVGRRALARWAASRGHDRPVILSPTLPPLRGRHDGLRAATRRALVGEQGAEALTAWAGHDPALRRALTELFFPQPASRYCLFNRATLFCELLLGLSERHGGAPVVLLLPEAHRAPEALELVAAIGAPGVCPPLRAILTLDPTSLEPLARAAWERLGAQRVPVRPLTDEELGLCLTGSFVSDPQERAALLTAAQGRPLFVRELGLDRALFGPQSDGPLPDTLPALWAHRLERALSAHPEPWRRGLELAAALGETLRLEEWWEACQVAAIDCPAEAWSAWEETGLLALSPMGLGLRTFAHPSLREHLTTSARSSRRWARYHLACAQLASRARDVASQERHGAHLLEAGAFEECLTPLASAALEHLRAGDLARGEALLDRRAQALDTLRIPYDDPRRCVDWLLRARIRRVGGQLAMARRIAARAERVARWAGEEEVRASAIWELGLIARAAGDLGLSVAALSSAEAGYLKIGAQDRADLVRIDLALALRAVGAYDPAEDRLVLAQASYEARGDVGGAAAALRARGDLLELRGDDQGAERALREALTRFQSFGARRLESYCANSLGEVARRRGRLAEAEHWYRASAALLRREVNNKDLIPTLNLGLVLIEQGLTREAEPLVRACVAHYQRLGSRPLAAASRSALLPILAAEGAWDELDQQLKAVELAVAGGGLFEPDVGLAARLAGEAALHRGQLRRAQRLLQLAHDQYLAVGRDELATELSMLVAGLT